MYDVEDAVDFSSLGNKTKLSQFRYKLPEELIAQYPLRNRDDSRMMVLHRKTGAIESKMFKDFLSMYKAGDMFVFNDTKVLPARLFGTKEKTSARIRVDLRRELNPQLYLWDVMVEPARKIRIGNKLFFGEDGGLVAEVIDNTTSRGRTLRFLFDGEYDDFKQQLLALGNAPLPDRIIHREPEEIDLERFQTYFAKKEGAVTAPSAGLHFSREVLKRMELGDIATAYITLHCGLNTFNNTEVEDLSKHKSESEWMEITPENAALINKAKVDGRQIIAVGTTVQRALETARDTRGQVTPYSGWTNKFIYPPYLFGVATAMFSNFHMPQSSLLMVTAAFGGFENTMRAYTEAVNQKYRFGPYGDVMLIVD